MGIPIVRTGDAPLPPAWNPGDEENGGEQTEGHPSVKVSWLPRCNPQFHPRALVQLTHDGISSHTHQKKTTSRVVHLLVLPHPLLLSMFF